MTGRIHAGGIHAGWIHAGRIHAITCADAARTATQTRLAFGWLIFGAAIATLEDTLAARLTTVTTG